MMKSRSSLLSDIGQMAQGAASLVDDMRMDAKNIMNSRDERKQNHSNLVTYEDFEALTTRLESLGARIEFLEATIQNNKTVKSAAGRKKTPKNKED